MRPLRMLRAAQFRGAEDALALPVGARVERDLEYGPDPLQRLDAYLPAGAPTGSILVLVHGGAWALGDKANRALAGAKVPHWLAAGIVVVSVNYRLLPGAGVLAQANDVALAIAFVRQRASLWQADASRVVVTGHSTGAHLAALLAADPSIGAAEQAAAPWLATILLDSATLDVPEFMRSPHRPLHDRAFGSDPAGWEALSPAHRLKGRPSPVLIVHSTQRADSADAAKRFAAAVGARGGRAEIHGEALSHADLNARLGLGNRYTERVDRFLQSVGVP